MAPFTFWPRHVVRKIHRKDLRLSPVAEMLIFGIAPGFDLGKDSKGHYGKSDI